MAVIAWDVVLSWRNPHTSPPDGQPRELLRVRVPVVPGGRTGAPETPAEIVALHEKIGYGKGYGVAVGCVETEPRRLSQETKGRIRMNRLVNRMQKNHPLFADQFIEEAIAKKPGYYRGEDVIFESHVQKRNRELRERIAAMNPASSVGDSPSVVQVKNA